MKNLIFVFIAAALLVFTSCSKENLDMPTPEKIESAVAPDTKIKDNNASQAFIAQTNNDPQARPVTIRLQVSEMSSTQMATQYAVDFIGSYDFTGVNLATKQTLKFTDTNSNISTMVLDVDAFVGGNGTLQVDFANGGNEFMGLLLVTAQEIVIEDFLIN